LEDPQTIEQFVDRIYELELRRPIEEGRLLIKMQGNYPNRWLVALQEKFSKKKMSERTVEKKQAIARAFAYYADEDVMNVDISALYVLSQPEVNDAIRKLVVQRAKNGEHITRIKALIAIGKREENRTIKGEIPSAGDAEEEAQAQPNWTRIWHQEMTVTDRYEFVREQLRTLVEIAEEIGELPAMMEIARELLGSNGKDVRLAQPKPEEGIACSTLQ
jgi:hypothetical protein